MGTASQAAIARDVACTLRKAGGALGVMNTRWLELLGLLGIRKSQCKVQAVRLLNCILNPVSNARLGGCRVVASEHIETTSFDPCHGYTENQGSNETGMANELG